MKVRTVITTEVQLTNIYALCQPKDKRKCAEAIHQFVDFQIRMTADPNGGWCYPSDDLIAGHLIETGLADSLV